MDEKRCCTSISSVPDPLFYSNTLNPRRPHISDELLEMKVDVEGSRIEIIPLHHAPPQCDPLPRRAAIGTGSKEPGVSRTESTENDEATTSKVQAGASEELARLQVGRQQRETASTEQSKQFDRGLPQ